MAQLYVIKADGNKEPFSADKVFRSAIRAGASRQLAQELAFKLKREAYQGITTSDIFKKVKKLLKEQSRKSALRFDLKRSIRELGPTGFPFEKYACEIFKSLGFEVKINQFISGKCVPDYEIDFVAEKENLIYIGECKYRHVFKERVDLKDALANYARFSDILSGSCFKPKIRKGVEIKTIMVSNGKFTNKAIDCSYCMGMELLGWQFPQNKGLEKIVESLELYPITILPSLRGYIKKSLVDGRLMLVRDILNADPLKIARKMGLQAKDFIPLIKEAKLLLGK